MATPEELENRLGAVERDVSELRRQTTLAAADSAAARVLAAGADRDVSEVRAELRAHTGALNALRETQTEMSHTIVRIDDRLGGVDDRLGGVETRVGGVDDRLGRVEDRLGGVEQTVTAGFASVGAGMTQILTLLESITEQ